MAEKQLPDVTAVMDRFLTLSKWKAEGLEEERKALKAQVEMKRQVIANAEAEIEKIEAKIGGLAGRETAARALAQKMKSASLDDTAIIVALQAQFGTKTFRTTDAPTVSRTPVDQAVCDAITAQLTLGTKLKKEDLVRITLNGGDEISHARSVSKALQSMRASGLVRVEGRARGMYYSVA